MKIMLMLAATSGSRGVFVEDYSPHAIILAFQDGRITLNQDWEGWRLWPEVLEVIPQPRRIESLQGRS